jgi:hypothetical protein
MSIVDTGRFWEILIIPVLQILANTGITSIVYQYCSTSIAAGCFILSILRSNLVENTGRFWKILVIPVLQILED